MKLTAVAKAVAHTYRWNGWVPPFSACDDPGISRQPHAEGEPCRDKDIHHSGMDNNNLTSYHQPLSLSGMKFSYVSERHAYIWMVCASNTVPVIINTSIDYTCGLNRGSCGLTYCRGKQNVTTVRLAICTVCLARAVPRGYIVQCFHL